MYDVIGNYHFHRDCVHYDSVVKEPRPEPKHKGRQFIKCTYCGYGMHYYCDSDFENIKCQCRHFESKEPSLFEYMEGDSNDGSVR